MYTVSCPLHLQLSAVCSLLLVLLDQKYSEKSKNIVGLDSYILNDLFVIRTLFGFILVLGYTALLKL